MLDLEFTHDNIPSADELVDLLQESPTLIDGLLALYEHLADLESKYEMSSSEFIRRYTGGEFGQDGELLQWVGLYHITEVLRLRIQAALWQTNLPRLVSRPVQQGGEIGFVSESPK